MKKLLALLLALLLLTGMAAAEGNQPTFESFGNDLWSFSTLGFDDSDFLFRHTITAGSDLAEKYVYCDEDTAVFITRGGDTMLRFTYRPSGERFEITRVEVFTAVTQADAGRLLEAITILAATLDVCEISIFGGNDGEFVETFTQETQFTMNGVTVTNAISGNAGKTYISVVFDGVSVMTN